MWGNSYVDKAYWKGVARMSKTKRFIIAELNGIQWIEEMVLNGEPITNIVQAVKKLNDLSEENEQLKKDCSNLIDDNTEYVAEINQMHKENEHIKNTIQEAYNNERTHIGRNVLKQLLNNIGETNE